jgi:hypothetical protein
MSEPDYCPNRGAELGGAGDGGYCAHAACPATG